MKLEHSLTPYTKINSKWIRDLNVRVDTINVLKKNVGRTLFDMNHSKIFFDLHPRVMEIKRKIYKWDLMKLHSFCKAKETKNKTKQTNKKTFKLLNNSEMPRFTLPPHFSSKLSTKQRCWWKTASAAVTRHSHCVKV